MSVELVAPKAGAARVLVTVWGYLWGRQEAVFVTNDGSVGMNVDSHIVVKPIAEWHALAKSLEGLSDG